MLGLAVLRHVVWQAASMRVCMRVCCYACVCGPCAPQKWLASDFIEERKLKRKRQKKLGQQVLAYFEAKQAKALRDAKVPCVGWAAHGTRVRSCIAVVMSVGVGVCVGGVRPRCCLSTRVLPRPPALFPGPRSLVGFRVPRRLRRRAGSGPLASPST
jgi:hypothetical protein